MIRSLPTILVFSLLAAACDRQVASNGDVILGGLFNIEGSQGQLDIPASRGARLAVDEINAAGGVLERQIQLVVEDGKSRPELVTEGAENILREHPAVSAFLGLSDTDMVRGAAQTAGKAGRLFLTPGATSPKLPSEVPQYLYLACFGDNAQAAAAAEFAFEKLGARSASILYDSTDSYTNLLQSYFRTRFIDLGGEIESAEAYSPSELSTPIGRLKQADIVFLSAHLPDHAVEAAGLLRATGFSMPIVGGAGFDAEETWAGEAAVRDVYFTTHVYLGSDASNDRVSAFRSAYESAYPGPPATAFAALGYDAVNLIAEAIRQADGSAPEDVLAGMVRIRDFDGVTGTISYPDGTQIPSKSVSIIGVDGGSYRLADERVPTQIPAP